MRNLRAELKGWDDGAPVEWKPAEDGILVGYVRGFITSDEGQSGDKTVIIEEESTGLQVLVSIAGSQLLALFELHSPRSDERVGIKYIGRSPKGEARFVMIVDRDNPLRGQTGQSQSEQIDGDEPESADDCAAATAQERDFIEMMLSSETSESEPECSSDAAHQHIEGLIERRQDELSRQTKTLERFESMITHSSAPAETSDNKTQTVFCARPQSEPEGRVPVKRPRHRLRWFLVSFVLLTASALAAAVVYFKIALPWQ